MYMYVPIHQPKVSLSWLAMCNIIVRYEVTEGKTTMLASGNINSDNGIPVALLRFCIRLEKAKYSIRKFR